MKNFITFTVFIFCIISTGKIFSQNDSTKEEVKWEMKVYYFVFLNAVKDRPQIDSVTAMEIQKGHIANLERMYYEGK